MTKSWINVASMQDLRSAGGVLARKVGGDRVALYAVEDEVYATSDICTHGAAHLSEGYLDGYLIECPLHQGQFDIRTGAAEGAPCSVPVRTFPVRREDDAIMLEIETADVAENASRR